MQFIKVLFFSFSVVYYICTVNCLWCTDHAGNSGTCVTLSKCVNRNEASENLEKEVDFSAFLSASICGFDGTNFLFCCRGVEKIKGTEISNSALTSNEVSSFHFVALDEEEFPGMNTQSLSYTNSVKENLSQSIIMQQSFVSNSENPEQMKLESSCGAVRGKINRVVGGSEAGIGSYPWMAALGFRDASDGGFSFLCAGTLITRRHVLTAAHCIQSTLAVVRLGAHNLSNAFELNAVNIPIKRISIHEMFNFHSITNDIAIIELLTDAPENDFISTICLPESNDFLSQDLVDFNPFVVGWGAMKFGQTSEPILRVAQVPIVDSVICAENYKKLFSNLNFDDKFICAGNGAVDACQGDSGGPLMMPQWNGYVYKYLLLGIVSYGSECAKDGFPGVYTRVPSYTTWIKSHL